MPNEFSSSELHQRSLHRQGRVIELVKAIRQVVKEFDHELDGYHEDRRKAPVGDEQMEVMKDFMLDLYDLWERMDYYLTHGHYKPAG